MKRFLPIKIFSIKYGYGWWFGNYFFFNRTSFAIVPCWADLGNCEYAKNGKAIEHGDSHSWDRYSEQFAVS